MYDNSINYKGIVDKERNPFNTPSWCKEGNPEGSGRAMQQTAIENFQLVLDKGGRIEDIKEPHREKYATFQAIRWGYAVVQGNRVVPTPEWDKISPKRGLNKVYVKNLPTVGTISTGRPEEKSTITYEPNSHYLNILNQSILMESLKKFDLNESIQNYLGKDNLREKSANQILKNFTFGNSIARAFHHESPSVQYQRWADQININEELAAMGKISSQEEYDIHLYGLAHSLENSWDDKTEIGNISRMNIGLSLKIMNLLMKHLTFVHALKNPKLIAYLHVPWDKFTLQPLQKIWMGNPRIDNSSSQGFVKTLDQYKELHNFITDIVSQAGVLRIAYEFWAWDNKH